VTGTVCLTVLFLFVVQFVPLCFAVSFDEAGEAVKTAERDLGSAFMAVAEAEGAGANVSVLLDKLGAAGVFLSEAHSAFSAGNYESAFSSAVACSSAAEGVFGDAARLKMDAEVASVESLFLTTAGSVIGVGLVLILGFVGWRFLKRRYFRRVLEMKPKVVDHD
jgi:hypothetical protein